MDAQFDTTFKMNALEAWHSLVENAGIEPQDRDKDLVDEIVETCGGATSIEEALEFFGDNSDALISLIFSKVSHYGEMYRDIFDFFKLAGSKSGDTNWKIEINNVTHELEHFLEYQKISKTISSEIEILDITLEEIRTLLREVFEEHSSLNFKYNFENSGMQNWTELYDKHVLTALPTFIINMFKDTPCERLIFAMSAFIDYLIIEGYWDRKKGHKHFKRSLKDKDFLTNDLKQMLQAEENHCIKYCLEMLCQISDLCRSRKTKVFLSLKNKLAPIKTKKIHGLTSPNFDALKKLLSLPVWRNRYDLYSVWVGIQACKCFADHDITINVDGDTIRFPFKKTKVFDFHYNGNWIAMYSEVRTSANGIKLRGKSRIDAVQPDFAFEIDQTNHTPLVIEVKHYKSPSRSFIAAVDDYGFVFNDSHILLVNHGGIPKKYVSQTNRNVERRAKYIGEFRIKNASSINSFKTYVKDKVLDAEKHLKHIEAYRQKMTLREQILDMNVPIYGYVNIIDVSASMGDELKIQHLIEFLQQEKVQKNAVILADRDSRRLCSVSDALKRLEQDNGLFTKNDIDPSDLHTLVVDLLPFQVLFLTDLKAFKNLGCFLGQFATYDSHSGIYAVPANR